MALALRSSATASGDWATTVTVTKPSGVVADDLLIALIHWAGTPMTHTGPSGWTLEVTLDEQEDRRATIWTKRAGGSEPANYTWSKASGGDYRVGGIAAFSGGITSNPYVDVKGAGDIGFQTTTATASSVTTTVVDTVV